MTAIFQPTLGSPFEKFFQQHLNEPAMARNTLWHHTIQALNQYGVPTDEPAGTPLTNVAFVLDASGSMDYGKATTIEGYNTQANVVREGAKAAGETTFTECLFASHVWLRRVAASVEALRPLTSENYRPGGSTALFDALGDTIAALLQTERIHAPTTATLVTVFTDGAENASQRYDGKALGQLIRKLEASGRWTFALVGPKGSVHNLAEILSIAPGNVSAYDPGSLEERQAAFGHTATASQSYMGLRAMGMTQASTLYQQEPGGPAAAA